MRQFRLALTLTLALAFAAPAAIASTSDDVAWHTTYDALMDNPMDPALNHKYLELCLAREDYEAAISPIERLLAQEPDNVELMLQLGQMYQQLGSNSVAKGYFEKVLAHPKATPELRKQATLGK